MQREILEEVDRERKVGWGLWAFGCWCVSIKVLLSPGFVVNGYVSPWACCTPTAYSYHTWYIAGRCCRPLWYCLRHMYEEKAQTRESSGIWWKRAAAPSNLLQVSPEWHPTSLMLCLSLTFLFYIFRHSSIVYHFIFPTLLDPTWKNAAASGISLPIYSPCLLSHPSLCCVHYFPDHLIKWIAAHLSAANK